MPVKNRMKLERIISGGQTGVDRAALDWAMAHGIPHGGWCPVGRLAEDGVIPDQYQLVELPNSGYRQRTRANVRDSDAKLIISVTPELSGGTLQTARFAKALSKPWVHVHPGIAIQDDFCQWFIAANIRTLNVAGPRASKDSLATGFTSVVLDAIFTMPIASQ